MSDGFTVRGVPRSIALDGWWLASDAMPETAKNDPPRRPPSTLGESIWNNGPLGLILLILLADFLLWGYKPAFALALFAWCIFGTVALGRGLSRGALKPAILLALATLPVLEYLQTLSVGILVIGLLSALVLLNGSGINRIDRFAASLLRLANAMPWTGPLALLTGLRNLQAHAPGRVLLEDGNLRAALRNWAFPVGGACVLSALLIGANPVIEQSLQQLLAFDLDLVEAMRRALFWGGTGLLLWPLLTVSPNPEPLAFAAPKWGPALGLNAGSVLRALLVFNLFLGVQSVLDFSILLGGAALPDGMSYATYAHRGAYPLLVTAMLAGAFALAARPFLTSHHAIKPLLLIWLLQNVLLTLSAVLRLDLYIAEFGLTYLRIHALIWMGLVAVGLILVGWQILRARSSLWLVVCSASLGFGTLYVCAFINFAALIATHTLERSATHRTDWSYFCALGPTANRAVARKLGDLPALSLPSGVKTCLRTHDPITNWREWDFRTLRTAS